MFPLHLIIFTCRRMPWERKWEGSQVYGEWEQDGVIWTIEDVNPEHDELIVDYFLTHFINDETMCFRLG